MFVSAEFRGKQSHEVGPRFLGRLIIYLCVKVTYNKFLWSNFIIGEPDLRGNEQRQNKAPDILVTFLGGQFSAAWGYSVAELDQCAMD